MTQPTFADLDRESYISLVTFRRDGREVATPVWFARDGDRLFVFSEARAGKVKRLRNSPRARIAPCNVTGRVQGPWIEVQAHVVGDTATERRAYAALHAKYGWQMWLADAFSALAGRIHDRAVLSIDPKPYLADPEAGRP